jgi:GH43 family beta-xylosidase
LSYCNPVWPHSFPDPFVLKHRGTYWAYCTGFWQDGRCFGILRSADLVRWEPQAGALAPLPGDATCYWAPEVTYDAGDGRFYLYYSVGDEVRMEIRVAVADHPGGPFTDSGRRLTAEPFAIDAHVFTSAEGSRWLFYATDFLDRSHLGTGTVRDRLLDPFTLAGDPRPVTLPRHDWHVYHPNRPEKGFVRWHTVEGPFVVERKGVLYQMFSGGNWQNPTYGVSYATARQVAGPEEWTQAADGERVLPILRTVRGPAGDVVGPGHNSVVRGPDNRELFCVYHRWSEDAGARVLAIDRLDWAGERMLILGPTTTPQPVPRLPAVADPAPDSAAIFISGPSFLCEVSARCPGAAPDGAGGVGLAVRGPGGAVPFLLPSGLDPSIDHLLRLEVDGLRASFAVDGAVRWRGRLPEPVAEVALVSQGSAAEMSGFALTLGWEELFEEDGDLRGDLGNGGWEGGAARVEKGRLWLDPAGAILQVSRGPAFESYELAVNVRLEGEASARIYPALTGRRIEPEIALDREGFQLTDAQGTRRLPFPAGGDPFDPMVDQQLRFVKQGGLIEISWEGRALGTLSSPPGPSRTGLGASGAASFEMVRVTALLRA